MARMDQYHAIIGRLEHVTHDGRGLTARCPFAGDRSRHPNGDRTPSFRAWLGEKGELVCRCMGCQATWRDVATAMGLPPTAFFPGVAVQSRIKSRQVAQYPYYDGDKLIAVKLRWEPGFIEGRSKDFTWKRPIPQGWANNLHKGNYVQKSAGWWAKTEGSGGIQLETLSVDHLLYGRMGDIKQPVIVCESEKDVDLLQQLGVFAVCPPFGCNKWTRAQSGRLHGRRVVVVADDGAIDHATRVAGSLLLSAASVRVVTPGGIYLPPPGKGLGNWLATVPEPERKAKLIQAVCEFREWQSVA